MDDGSICQPQRAIGNDTESKNSTNMELECIVFENLIEGWLKTPCQFSNPAYCTFTKTVVVCTSLPLVPVTVTV